MSNVFKIDPELAKARRGIAVAKSPKDLGVIADALDSLKDLATKAGLSREEINKIADVHIDTARAGGRMLINMGERGERARHGKMPRDISNNPLTLNDMGFTSARATRWQIAARLPDNLLQDYRDKVDGQIDGTKSLGGVVKAGKLYLGKARTAAEVTPSEATIASAPWQDWLPHQDHCDVLMTDPPYSTDVDDIAGFAAEWLPEALAKVKPTGRAYVCIGAYPIELHAYLSIAPPKHMLLSQVLVWTYRNRVGPSPTHDYKLNWQAIVYYRGVDAPPLNCSRAVSEYPDLNEQFSVQDINLPDPRRHEARLAHWHAWQKPDDLCERLVRHSSQPGELILDPFAGTGSFILAAARLGRVGMGCDQDKEMVKIAVKRGAKCART